MATKAANKRLTREYKVMQDGPPPFVEAHPSEGNILIWHYLITGPPGTPYEGGQYHGILTFPSDYPYKPPGIKMVTPSGRFQPNTRLCLSISDFHPKSWNPAWSVSTILTGLLSFMTSDEITSGSISTTEVERRRLAKQSKSWNLKSNPKFLSEFQEVAERNARELLEGANKVNQPKKPETTPAQIKKTPAGGSSKEAITIDDDDDDDDVVLLYETAGVKRGANSDEGSAQKKAGKQQRWYSRHPAAFGLLLAIASLAVAKIFTGTN